MGPTDTTALVAFLRARLDEDARLARRCAGDDCGDWVARGDTVDFCQMDLRGFHPTIAAHVARYDPARVLAAVDATRRVVDAAERRLREAADPLAVAVLRALALPYADHADYRVRWRP